MYSGRHHEMRVHDHVFYEAQISAFPDKMKSSHFTLDGVSYDWMTMEKMKQDVDSQKKNWDIGKP